MGMGGYGSKLLSRGSVGNISFPDSDCECDDSAYCGNCGKKDGNKKDKSTNTESLVVTKFYCRCPPCDLMKSPFEDLSNNFDTMTFIEAELKDNQESVRALKIKQLPTFVVFRDQQEVGRHVGLNPISLYKFLLDIQLDESGRSG